MGEPVITLFLKTLEQLQKGGQLITGIQEEVEWIKRELEAMLAFLKEADRGQRRDGLIRAWVGEVRNLVYDAEDIIDTFVIHSSTLRWNLIKHIQMRYQVNSQIRKIKRRVTEVKERRDRYGILASEAQIIYRPSSKSTVATQMFKEEKFGAILVDRNNEIEDRQRRLSVYSDAENILANIELRLVRLLDLQGVGIESLPDEVGDLINLRYLDFRGTMIKNLPNSMKNLRNLQTLDIRNTNVSTLPRGINMLTELRHLHMASFSERDNKDFLKMPKGKVCFKELQTLSGIDCDQNFMKQLRSLTNLRKLYIGGITGSNSKELCSCLREMKKLSSLTIISKHPTENLQLNTLLRSPPRLEKLKLQGSLRRLPSWFQSLNCFHTLYLCQNLIEDDPFPILEQLPNLLVLTLASSAFLCRDICCNGFHHLTALQSLTLAGQEWAVYFVKDDAAIKFILQSSLLILTSNVSLLLMKKLHNQKMH
ncbi:hypothetical protein Pint_09714 [Pistacia integerrima]|uniref:Uncharacterized protein n=1 Tax=Pistacia integerrima TaxID=434235 RepID=A0ACC0XHF0_9ROSI|nr:hypothetical protein Pint_09714 [Pistacia integerrima]